MVKCILRFNDGRSAPEDEFWTKASSASLTRFQTLFINLNEPSIARSFHSNSTSGGAAKRINKRRVSAPYFSIIPSGSTTLPLDFDITSPSFKTIPCVNRRLKGSEKLSRPKSFKNLVKKREYKRCKTACSIPPIYWSTDIQYLTFSLSKISVLVSGLQNLKKYQEESIKVAMV